MENSRLPPNLDQEVDAYLDAMQQNQDFQLLVHAVSREIRGEIQQSLSGFQEAIAQQHYQSLELMRSQIEQVQQQAGTLGDVTNRLAQVAAPDLDKAQDVTSLTQAIENLEKYGSIIPTSTQLAAYKVKAERNHAVSLLGQSIALFIIKGLKKVFDADKSSSVPQENVELRQELWDRDYPL